MSGAPKKKQKTHNNLKALILVGGYGTRLRPFTFSLPKPLIPFVNKPIVMYQIEALVKVGVKEIILAVNYKPQKMLDYLSGVEQKYGVKITMSQEDVPLGTAGPLALAKKILGADDSPFFMFNSDVICEFPLKEMLSFHLAHGGEGTLFQTPVEDPSKYGVILSDSNGKISAFLEKPKEFVSDKINAGIYLLSPPILKRIQLKPTSIEREIFPKMAKDNQLYTMTLPGYWMDIGQPKDFLTGMCLHLAALRRTEPDSLAKEGKGYTVEGNCFVDPTAKIGNGAKIGPNVVLGADVEIGAGARVKRATIMKGAKVGQAAFVSNSIIGWETRVGPWCRVDGCFMGEDVNVANESSVKNVTVCPHKGVKQDEADKIVL